MQHDPSAQQKFDARNPVTRWQSFSGTTGQYGVRTILLDVATRLDQSPVLSPGLRENAILVLAEVLNNIEEHGYQGQDRGRVKVKVCIRANEIELETQDFGGPMPGLSVPKKCPPITDAPRDALQEGGFGWYLIHTLAPNPVYSRRGQTNILRFTISEI